MGLPGAMIIERVRAHHHTACLSHVQGGLAWPGGPHDDVSQSNHIQYNSV